MLEPTREQVLQQVEAICRSDTFEGHKRPKALLRYIVEGSLTGKKLTESEIAEEFFKRNASNYHPKANSIVRVSIAKLRDQLQEYYSKDGETAPLLITIPRGAYRAEFQFNLDFNRNGAIPPLPLSQAWYSYLQAHSRFERKLAALGFPSKTSPLPQEMYQEPWKGYKRFSEIGVWSAIQFYGVAPTARLSYEMQMYMKSEGFTRSVLEHEDGIMSYYCVFQRCRSLIPI